MSKIEKMVVYPAYYNYDSDFSFTGQGGY